MTSPDKSAAPSLTFEEFMARRQEILASATGSLAAMDQAALELESLEQAHPDLTFLHTRSNDHQMQQ